MKIPLQITFRGLDHSEALAEKVRRRAEKLDAFADDLIGCRVVIEERHRHHREGNLFHVRVDLTVKGGEITASREHELHHGHTDAHVAVRDAFDEVERRLQDHARRVRGQVKSHAAPARGWVSLLKPEAGYGFLTTGDGREVYFHRNSVLGSRFADLEPGDEVRFEEESGEKGPQASTVHAIGGHRLVN